MKFPGSRKDPKQMLILVALGACVLIYGIVAFGAIPLLKSRRETAEKIVEYRKKIDNATKEIKKAADVQDRNEGTKAELRAIDRSHIIKAEFGRYIFKVQAALERAAAAAGVQLRSISEIGRLQIPSKQGKGFKRVLVAYSVQVPGRGSYEELMEMLKELEASNPFIAVWSLEIEVLPDSIEKQQVTFKAQWPVWDDSGITSNFVETAKERTPESEAPRQKRGKKAAEKEG